MNIDLKAVLTKSDLKQLIKEVIQEQSFDDFSEEDPVLIDEIEGRLKTVAKDLAFDIRSLQSKLDYVSVMLRAINSQELGGTVVSGPGMSDPVEALKSGTLRLYDVFDSYGQEDLADQIELLITMNS